MKSPLTFQQEAQCWTRRYEQLREQVLADDNFIATDRRGLAVLIREGMAAWMRAWSACMQNTAPETLPRPDTPPPCPLDVRTQLAGILTGMILNQQLEITR